MKANFTRALDLTLEYEGGFVNHPKDPGGATMRGVTQKVYDRWRVKRGLPVRPVRQIEEDELQAIYRLQYWDLVHGDRLPAGLDAAVFDFAVNSGATRATQELQRVLGLRTDGNMGAVTIDAAAATDQADLINRYCDARLAFVRRLSTFSTFGKGWTRRIQAVRSACLAMTEGQTSIVGFMAADGLAGGDGEDELDAAAPADPRDMRVVSTGGGQGAITAGAGTAGVALTEAADRVSWVSEHSEVLKTVFVLILVAGIGLTLYAQLRSIRTETPE